MRMQVLFGAASVVAVVGMLWGSVAPARACVTDPTYDYIGASSLIVEGRFSEWRPAPDIPTPDGPYKYEAVRVRMDVEKVYKGYAGTTIDVVTIVMEHNLANWRGENPPFVSSGNCPATFNERSPVGNYVIVGLRREADGTFREAMPWFVGDGLNGRDYDEGVRLLVSRLPEGGGPSEVAGFPFLSASLVLVGPLAFVVGAALLWRRGG